MITNESEYQLYQERIASNIKFIVIEEQILRDAKVSEEEIRNSLKDIKEYNQKLMKEVEIWKRSKKRKPIKLEVI